MINIDFHNRAFRSVDFNSGQKMALRAFYFIHTLTKALIYYYIKHSQQNVLTAIENNRSEGPIEMSYISRCFDNVF